VTSHELSVFLILGAGLLAMPIGAYGVLEALNKRRKGQRLIPVLITTYVAGVLLCGLGLSMNGQWYLGAGLAAMLVPVEAALRQHGLLGRRRMAQIEG
jgi:hypothetical protein